MLEELAFKKNEYSCSLLAVEADAYNFMYSGHGYQEDQDSNELEQKISENSPSQVTIQTWWYILLIPAIDKRILFETRPRQK
jgi:hypothetical protein